jgi:hypothetical protein
MADVYPSKSDRPGQPTASGQKPTGGRKRGTGGRGDKRVGGAIAAGLVILLLVALAVAIF